jgi:putative methionine-R-sulfoxide reductase with GAF domain
MAIETDLETGRERRRFDRRSISEFQLLTADVVPAGAGTQRQQRCIVLNVSEGGLAVQPFLRLTPGNLVELRFGVPGASTPFTSKGMVAWTGSGGPVGIQLIDQAPEIRESLRKWVGDDLGLISPQPGPDSAGLGAQEFESALQLIAKRAQVVTRANGVAIALGDAESMVCRASEGVAPELGVSLRAGFGLTGQCLSTGKLVQSPDARSDSRVDAAVARQLQLGSAVIVPICAPGKIAGVLGVFSRHPRAFDNFHIRRLERLAAVIAIALHATLVEPPEGESKPEITARSDRPEMSRFVPTLPTPKPLAVPVAGRPLHRLESLWNMIEIAQHRRGGSSPVQ